MSQKPMNFAVIGCGAMARGQHIPNIAKSPKTVLHTLRSFGRSAQGMQGSLWRAEHL